MMSRRMLACPLSSHDAIAAVFCVTAETTADSATESIFWTPTS
jgi:hypothetical protein